MSKLLLIRPKGSLMPYKSSAATFTRASTAQPPEGGDYVGNNVPIIKSLGLKGGELFLNGGIVTDAIYLDRAGTNPDASARAADNLWTTLPKKLPSFFTIVGAFQPNFDNTFVSVNTSNLIRIDQDSSNQYTVSYSHDEDVLKMAVRTGGSWRSSADIYHPIVDKAKVVSFVASRTPIGYNLWLQETGGVLKKQIGAGNLQYIVPNASRLAIGNAGLQGSAYEAKAYILPPKFYNYACMTDSQAQALINSLK